MHNSDYITLDKAVIEENIKQFENSRKVVLSKVRFDNGFKDSIIGLNFMNELMDCTRISSNVNIYHLAYNVAYDFLKSTLDSMPDDEFYEILTVVNHWSKAFRCAYEHSSSVNFSWAMRELLKEVKPIIERLAD